MFHHSAPAPSHNKVRGETLPSLIQQMTSFNIDKEMQPVYDRFPEGGRRPVIGLTANFSDGKAMIMAPYYEQVA